MNPETPPPTPSSGTAPPDPARCGLCGRTEKLTRTPCCGNWICDDENEYVPFSYARNSCSRNHAMFTMCRSHHPQGHEGRWQDCAACRESLPLEVYVHHATNEYNFQKLENPPSFEPACCERCGVRVRLAQDGYSMSQGNVHCLACSELANPGVREAFSKNLPGQNNPPGPDEKVFPIGTLAYYGPTSRLATKMVAAVVKSRDAEPDPLHRWISTTGDIRDDRASAAQVAAFFRRHRVKEIASSDRIIGCPHEEGKDYPLGGQCPHCPYWHNRDRFTLDALPAGGMSAAEIVAELSKPNPKRQPLDALAAAELQREELVRPLLAALERGIGAPTDTPPGESLLFSYATYLFAKWREPRAYPLIIRWLSLPDENAFEIGSDTVTTDGGRILASVCDGDLEPIKQLILNRDANEYCRSEAIQALAMRAAWQETPLRQVTDYFTWLAREGLEREPSEVWNQLMFSSVDLEALDAFPALRRACAEVLVDPGVMDPEELDEVEGGPRGQWLAHFRQAHPPIADVVAVTAGWWCFSDDPLVAMSRDAMHERACNAIKPEPIRGSPKVGRNEPCPCGSGKKYKRCCGQTPHP